MFVGQANHPDRSGIPPRMASCVIVVTRVQTYSRPSMAEFHIAQLNIGRLAAPLDSAQLADFVEGLVPINALADESPGFVWRLQTDEGDATAIRAFDDDLLRLNMSVWETIESLSDFVYRSEHREFLARRREFFERTNGVYVVLWWVPAGTIPSVDDAIERLDRLREHGPTPVAFSFRVTFPAPGARDTTGEAVGA